MTQPNAHARRIARRAAEREQARQAAPTYIPNNVLRQSDARAIVARYNDTADVLIVLRRVEGELERMEAATGKPVDPTLMIDVRAAIGRAEA